MSRDSLPNWYPENPPIYDIHKTYLDNALHGPFFKGEPPARIFPPKSEWIDFLDVKIASRLGVPAGPLLTANWIKLAANLGFDVVTYKTIRSRQHPAHPLPNMIYVDTHGSTNVEGEEEKRAAQTALLPSDIEQLAVTNSFGMPSMAPDFLMQDIARANSYLKAGQVMIVSVVGTPRPNEDFRDDFVQAARFAKEAGAKIIEANFSCPNVEKSEGCLYMSPQTVLDIASALVKAIHPTPLILKMGVFSNEKQMRDVLIASAKAGVRAVEGINSVSMRVVNEKKEPALGQSRLTSGICGGPIRQAALHFIRQAAQINKKEKLGLTLIGCGGITAPAHFDHFLEAGAEVAMSATGMMWDPYLALKYHQSR
ncbi:MAG: tRNA-dihydrouridine synthase [Chlamydiales bacterium]|nr:tRNA-dihydrouridine synthase [Chlamydiales bacterium]